ncbi:MAG TPA: TrkH family potassium uptake protein, partial [bacterium]|nr:TrkH family potassium uptake protein [bacterium]
MIPNFSREDISTVGYYLGRMVFLLGFLQGLPLLLAIVLQEWAAVPDFLLSVELSLILGAILSTLFPPVEEINWRQGMVLVALTWLVAMFLSALPLYLSGHFLSYLDACFECMSAYATTGLVLVQDLDHLSTAHNFWRHFMCFIGGQGIILVAVIFLFRGSGAFRVYVGEARDARILPNVRTTAYFIWLVSCFYLVLGSGLLSGCLVLSGVNLPRALFHGICIFMAGWDTAGFAPQSLNILYYHNAAFEMLTIIFFLLGAISFTVHYSIWTGHFRELKENYELKVLLGSIVVTYVLALAGFGHSVSRYPGLWSFFRSTFYQLVSGHTGVGFSNITVTELAGWSQLTLMGIIFAMGLGGCTNSTSGGIKALRTGLFFKSVRQEVRRFAYPEGASIQERFHHQRNLPVDDRQMRVALTMAVCYLALYLSGALLGTLFGYDFVPSLFESVSASANVGLSAGLTSSNMPVLLKIWYIFQMWCGRLEFIPIFILGRFLLTA